MSDNEERKFRENSKVPTEGWSRWVRVMVPEEYVERECYYLERSDGHVGFFCKNVRKAFDKVDCGIYEFKAVYKQEGISNHEVVYVGKAFRKSKTDLEDRIEEYCLDGSHIPDPINRVLQHGYQLYVRVKEIDGNKRAVSAAEKEMLDNYNYAWNTDGNVPYRGETFPPCPPN